MPSHATDVVGVGASSVDMVYRVPTYPAPDGAVSKVAITEHHVYCGGQTATTLATCARLGLRTAFIGTFGTDDRAQLMRDALEACGVDLGHVVVRPGAQPFAVIVIAEDSGERVVLWRRDPGLALRPEDVDAVAIRATRLLHVDDVDLAAAHAACAVGRAAGLSITSDIESPRAAGLIDAVTIPIFAESVPAALTGVSDPAAALQALRQPHHQGLVVTRGARGAVGVFGDAVVEAPGVVVDTIDTTGAGDVFRGAFITAWLEHRQPAEVLRCANAAAAASCTRQGAMASVPTLDEVRRLSAV